LAGKDGGTLAVLVMELGIAKSTEMKACLRDVVQTICLTAVCHLAIFIDHERTQSQHSIIQRIPEKQLPGIVLLRKVKGPALWSEVTSPEMLDGI
jgi:hypothetical protein